MSLRLLVITDLWGLQNAEWLQAYTSPLSEKTEVIVYDSQALGEVDEQLETEEEVHQAFINGGLEKAVENLVLQETRLRKAEPNEAFDVLAFSIGGAIAWKAALAGLNVRHLYALSSTRLRKETVVPEFKFSLIFGEEDAYRPDSEWQAKMGCEIDLVKGKEHIFYREVDIAAQIVRRILEEI